MKKSKILATIILAAALAIGCVTGALATNGSISKDLFYRDIKITLNGQPVTPTDSDGNVVEPFIIDGTTYLPVRGIANAMGLDVQWDDATGTVQLSSPDQGAGPEAVKPPPAPVETPPAAVQWYSESTYKVGTEIPAGEYYVEAVNDRTGYVFVHADSSGNNSLESDSFKTNYFITVENGQYIEVRNAKMTLTSNFGALSYGNTLQDGMYRVGIDIPAGEYKATANEGRSGYFFIYDSSRTSKHSFNSNSFKASDYFTVSDGQYLELRNCTAYKT